MRDSPSMSLHLHAGVDTWYGPRAEECTSELTRAQQAMHRAADELDDQACRYEAHADELVAVALRAERAERAAAEEQR
ncbi:hypothetical protein [Ilumatobacter nonamiensis]|uniref:hypothetical protein n=1 Tax=Ilumatobacter nonamiensis TaxID=467093 RepID=UPI00058DABAF|nr:hypothetical protein [Ilumatobacter nonamiensis]